MSNRLANLFNRPAVAVYALIVPLTLLAWGWLFLSVNGIYTLDGEASLGPAMQWLKPAIGATGFGSGDGWIAWLAAIVTPSTHFVALDLQSISVMFFMWFAMVIAMMLPSAAPMLRTYAEIADTAARMKQSAVPLVIFAGGYLAVWTGFALVATALQASLILIGAASASFAPVTGLVGALVLILAGLYQFMPLKNACLVKCRNPFTTLFGQWSTTSVGTFRLGMKEGWYCLGCCWAIMLVMLAVGTMNLVWMLLLTLFTIAEKSGAGLTFSRVFGVVLLIWGLFLLATSASLTFS